MFEDLRPSLYETMAQPELEVYNAVLDGCPDMAMFKIVFAILGSFEMTASLINESIFDEPGCAESREQRL